MHGKPKRPSTGRGWTLGLGALAVLMFGIRPWFEGRAPGIEDAKIFAVILMGLLAARWIGRLVRKMPPQIPREFSRENPRTPRFAYLVVGVGLSMALVTLCGFFSWVCWMR
jgi:hypothetical protein